MSLMNFSNWLNPKKKDDPSGSKLERLVLSIDSNGIIVGARYKNLVSHKGNFYGYPTFLTCDNNSNWSCYYLVGSTIGLVTNISEIVVIAIKEL